MDAYGPAESSEDPATIEDDEQEDEELNASSGDDPNSTERADEEPNASSGDDLNSTEQEGEEPIVSSGDDPNSTWQNWQELMDEYIFDDDED